MLRLAVLQCRLPGHARRSNDPAGSHLLPVEILDHVPRLAVHTTHHHVVQHLVLEAQIKITSKVLTLFIIF
jgi:hypothetical protein